MRYSVLLERLQNLINRKVEQAELCKVLNQRSNTIYNRKKRDSDFQTDEIEILNTHYGINLYTNTTQHVCITPQSDKVLIDYYPDVCGSCGNGVFQFST